eukprot:CAMPEP_0181071076 /NCGR_PEP_ID=MMETSP1070-20121207/27830_1 /TAXON_ID=265543 /ORGANISM="Minutocellus polymorphus, Strain NH13" /LENGTH=831 /DNA_ID=CAMNT_0023152011 /DNA_START=47 /DNA_END=2542 /DNA_ORIENTATION=-
MCTDDGTGASVWGYAAVKTIRNAVLASSVEGMSLASSWGFAGTDHGAAGDAANSAADNSSKPPQLSREAFAELAALRSLASGKHPCVVPLLAAYPSQSGLSRGMGLSLAFPYCPSDLSSAIQRRRYNVREGDASGGTIPDHVVKAIVRDMMLALQHCHEHGVVHGDVNPANFMISAMGRIQLGDFGLATACPSLLRQDDKGRSESNDGEKLPSHALCAINYRAPEIFLGETFAHPSQDIWGAGLILCELLTLRTAFPGRNDIDQLNRIFDILGTPSNKIWPNASSLPDFGKIRFDPREPHGIETIVPRVGTCQELQEVADATVSMDPRTRPSASECLKMSWLAAASTQSLPATNPCQVLEAMVPGDFLVSPVIFSGGLESAKRDAVAVAKKRRDLSRRQYNPSGSAGKFVCRVRGNGLLPALFMASILLNGCCFCEAFQVHGTRSVRRPLNQDKANFSPTTFGKYKAPLLVTSNDIFQSSTAIQARGPVGYDDEYFRRKRMSFRGRGTGLFSNLSVQKVLVLVNMIFFLLQLLSAANYAPVLSVILSRSNASGAVSLKGSLLAKRMVVGDSALTVMGRSQGSMPLIVASSVGAFTMDFAHQTALSSIQPHRLITSGFLHGSLLHLAFNMRYLWTIPRFVEEGLGWPLYLSTYLASVVAGNLAHSSVASSGPAALGLCLGASGGICGMLQGLMFVLLNRMGNKTASMSIFKNMIWLIIFGSLTPGISNAGHVGGFIAGALVGWLFGPRYGSSYRMKRKFSLAVDDASPEYRSMMGFGIEQKEPRLKLRYLWLALALLAWYKPIVRTIPICLLLGFKSPGLLSGLQMSVPPLV